MVESLLMSHSDLSSFKDVYSPDLQLACARNEERAFFGTAPTLVVINQAYGETAAEQWLVYQLIDLCAYCGAKEKLSVRQLKQLAYIITTEYGHFKASEVLLFLHRFKAGKYGRFYGNIDPLIIMDAMGDFADEREDAIILHNKKEEAKEPEEPHETISPQEWRRQNGLPEVTSVLEAWKIGNRIQDIIEAVLWLIRLLNHCMKRIIT